MQERRGGILTIQITYIHEYPRFRAGLEQFQSSCIRGWVEHASVMHSKAAEKGETLATEARALVTSVAKAEFKRGSQMHR